MSAKKTATHPAPDSSDEVIDLRPDAEHAGPDDDDDDLDSGPPPPPASPDRGGRKRSGNSKVASAVFKDEAAFQEFLDDAQEAGISPSAYALRCLLNRHNTDENAGDWQVELEELRDQLTAMRGAKENLQGLYEQAVRDGGNSDLNGLSGLDVPASAAEVRRQVQRGIEAGLAERENKEKLARLVVVEKELAETRKKLDEAEQENNELNDQLEAKSGLEANAKTFGPLVVQGVLRQYPGLARMAVGPLGALAGLQQAELDSMVAGSPGAGQLIADSLTLSVDKVRDNITPRQSRELESLLDFIAANPQALPRFTEYVQKVQQAAGQPAPAPTH